METLFITAFLVMALSSGALFGGAVYTWCRCRRQRPRRAWIFLLSSVLLGLGAILVYEGLLVQSRNSAKKYPSASEVIQSSPPWEKYQFELDAIRIPRADPTESVRSGVSLPAALEYLDSGAEVWNRKFKCIGCHVNGIFLMLSPELSQEATDSLAATRQFFIENLKPLVGTKEEIFLLTGNRSAQVVYAAAGLAAWDAYLAGNLSAETETMLRCMFRLQQEDGSWRVPVCWPPLQSNPFQLATVAAIAVATAPGWVEGLEDKEVLAGIDLLRNYLGNNTPPHDYAAVWLLWASTDFRSLLEKDVQSKLAEMIWSRQNEDGGWAIRDFASPAQWGGGVRQKELEGEPDYANSASDGHMTGLAVAALRDWGAPKNDERIQKAVKWLKANQRESGRWWTRSLNTDTYHLINYSGTCLALTALMKCDELKH